MNWWEEMIITMALGVLHQVVKNPAKQAQLRALLLNLADEIDAAYGLAPPTHT